MCTEIVSAIPGCLDAVQFSLEQYTRENAFDAHTACRSIMMWDKAVARDPYDFRTKVGRGVSSEDRLFLR